MENSLVNFGANIIKPLENLNFVISAETSLQNISKDHDVDRISILSGFYFNNHQKFMNPIQYENLDKIF